DLRRFQEGEVVRARHVRGWERAVKWARRRPAVASLLAAVLVVLASGIGATAYFWVQAVERAAAAETSARQAEGNARSAREAQDESAARLARSLVRETAYGRGPALAPIGVQGLQELARASDAVRLHFIAHALSRPDAAQRLAERPEPVAIAAVGLDGTRR